MDFDECKLAMFYIDKTEITHADTTENTILIMRNIVLKLKYVKQRKCIISLSSQNTQYCCRICLVKRP